MFLVFFPLYNDNVAKVDPPAPLPQSKSMHRLMTCTMFPSPTHSLVPQIKTKMASVVNLHVDWTGNMKIVYR